MSCFHLTLISLEIAIVKNIKETRENIRGVKVLAHNRSINTSSSRVTKVGAYSSQ